MITLRFVPAPDQEYGKWGFIDIAVETFADVMESLGTAWDGNPPLLQGAQK